MSSRAQPRTDRGIAPQAIVLVLAFGLAIAMTVQPVRQLLRQRHLLVSMTDDLRDLRNSNGTLEARIERLQDPDYLEQRAREQTGLVRPGETTFVVMPPRHRRAKDAERDRPTQARGADRPEGFVERLLHFVGVG